MVLGKVAVLLIAVVKVVTGLEDFEGKVASSTRVAFVIVATLLMVVGLVAWFVEAWEWRPSQARPITLTAGYQV